MTSSGPSYNFIDYNIIKPSWLGTPDNVHPFITSFGTEPISPATSVYLNLQLKVPSDPTQLPPGNSTNVPSEGSN